MNPHSLDDNPGHLKVELAARGIRLDQVLRAQTDLRRAADDESPQGVELVLPDGVCVNAPVGEGSDIPYLLSGTENHVRLQRNGTSVEVRMVPEPRFYGDTTSSAR